MVKAGEKFGNYQTQSNSDGKLAVVSETPDSITIRGSHVHLGTLVAIKVIHHPAQAQGAFDAEVKRAAAAAGLFHPNITRVLDFGVDGDRLYRVMEWCDGGDLKTFAAGRGEDRDPALQEWFLQGASALACAHEHGIVHGDIKPSNLLIARDRESAVMKVADFGFASSPEDDGEGDFAAPERKDGRTTPASDVYSLAAVFGVILGVRLPGTEGEAPLLPHALDPAWRRLLESALAREPGARPGNGASLQRAIRAEFPDAGVTPVSWSSSGSSATAADTPPPPPPVKPPVEESPPPLPPAAAAPIDTPPPAPPSRPIVVETAPAFAPVPRPAKAAKKSPVGAIVILLVLAAMASGGGYFAWQHFKNSKNSVPEGAETAETSSLDKSTPSPPPEKPVQDSTPPQAEKIAHVDSPPPPAPVESAPAEVTPSSPKIIKIPGDAATLKEALTHCASDGTIEINGGTYRESLLITRPVNIVASGDAALEDDGKIPTLLIAKGNINVSISGLSLRNAQKKGAGNPDEVPPLMLIASGAHVKMEKCTVEGGQGDGMTVADNGNAELTECRVMKNRGFGCRISGGSGLTVSEGAIQENGLGGVWVSNSGTRMLLKEGGAVNRNTNNGIQVMEGATLVVQGGGVSFNSSNGVMALDAATKIDIKDSALVSDNRISGIALLNGASLSVSSSKIERNHEYGLLAERSGKLSLSGAVFRSNSMAGVFINGGNGQSCRIERSEFIDHSEFGVAFVDSEIFVSGCTFSENGGALLLGKDTKGEISGNSISPGPVAKAIVREGAGQVKETDNTAR